MLPTRSTNPTRRKVHKPRKGGRHGRCIITGFCSEITSQLEPGRDSLSTIHHRNCMNKHGEGKTTAPSVAWNSVAVRTNRPYRLRTQEQHRERQSGITEQQTACWTPGASETSFMICSETDGGFGASKIINVFSIINSRHVEISSCQILATRCSFVCLVTLCNRLCTPPIMVFKRSKRACIALHKAKKQKTRHKKRGIKKRHKKR